MADKQIYPVWETPVMATCTETPGLRLTGGTLLSMGEEHSYYPPPQCTSWRKDTDTRGIIPPRPQQELVFKVHPAGTCSAACTSS